MFSSIKKILFNNEENCTYVAYEIFRSGFLLHTVLYLTTVFFGRFCLTMCLKFVFIKFTVLNHTLYLKNIFIWFCLYSHIFPYAFYIS